VKNIDDEGDEKKLEELDGVFIFLGNHIKIKRTELNCLDIAKLASYRA